MAAARAVVTSASALIVMVWCTTAVADLVVGSPGNGIPATNEATYAALTAKGAAEAAAQQSLAIAKGLGVAIVALSVLALYLLYRLRRAQGRSDRAQSST